VSDTVLSDEEVLRALEAPDGPAWELAGGQLVKSVSCADFAHALSFVNDVGRLAEESDHHPDIDIRYSRVTLALVTHSAGGITARDLDLARAIDAVAP
jgi:4a-hydroxytetrahydrobiopterin dehydratase